MILKNGVLVSDPRLGRIPKFDERSKNFRVRDLVGEKPLRSYTWRCTTLLDQGNSGSCVGHGIAHELIARPAESKGIDHRFAEEKIYWEAQKIDEWEGGAYPNANPQYEGTSVIAGVKIGRRLGYYEGYYWAFGLADTLLGLAYHGPAVLGIYWTEGMMEPDAKGYIRPTGQIIGGHCLLANQIEISAGCVNLVNSWGLAWGENGCAKITFKDLDKLLRMDGEAVFFVHRHAEPKA